MSPVFVYCQSETNNLWIICFVMENDIKISKTVILNNFDQYDDAIIGHMVPTEIHQLKSHMKRLKRGLATSHTF